MVNQQKGVQQDTAYSAVISPSLPISFFHVSMTHFGPKTIYIGTGIRTYDQLHYRQYLVALLFADLPSLSLFIS